jgi:hypothetical protein
VLLLEQAALIFRREASRSPMQSDTSKKRRMETPPWRGRNILLISAFLDAMQHLCNLKRPLFLSSIYEIKKIRQSHLYFDTRKN